MADLQNAMWKRLTDDNDVSAIVDDRVHWRIRPQGGELPAVRLNTISDVPDEHLKGRNGRWVSRIQADCMALDYGTTIQLADAVVAAMSSIETVEGVKFGWTKVDGRRDSGEDIPKGYVFMTSMDLLVEHELA